MQSTDRRTTSGDMKITVYAVFGVVFFVLGIIALIRPNFALPAKKSEMMIQNQKVLIETSRVISIPRPISATEVALGVGLVFLGSRKPRQR